MMASWNSSHFFPERLNKLKLNLSFPHKCANNTASSSHSFQSHQEPLDSTYYVALTLLWEVLKHNGMLISLKGYLLFFTPHGFQMARRTSSATLVFWTSSILLASSLLSICAYTRVASTLLLASATNK
ncbi:hypothetical protein V6N13_082546 [Hibiscus sabdariffa]|uniref:Uncharacterized protein n=1 Tax=Hibiscus sabdariffa TaxID=183260 RepID=A0ABR2Q3R8_9ROSI